MKKVFFWFFVYSVLVGCDSANLPEVEDESPVFAVSGVVNDLPISLQAGVDNYYMFTDLVTDVSGRQVQVGRLEDQNNASDKPSFSFYYYGAPSVDFLELGQGAQQFAQVETTILQQSLPGINLMPEVFGGSSLVSAEINLNGASYDPVNPLYSSAQQGLNSVTMSMTTASGCAATAQASCFLDANDSLPFYTFLRLVAVNDSFTRLESNIVGGVSPYSVTWFGPDANVIGLNDTSLLVLNAASTYSVQIVDQLQRMLTASVHMGTDSLGLGFCGGSLVYSIDNQTVNIFEPENYSNAWVVVYKDGAGKSYSSAQVLQPQQSKFDILQVEPYLLNNSGQKTKKVTALMNLILKSADGSTVIMDNFNAVFGIAVPE